MSKLTEKVVVEREVTGPIADLVFFVKWLREYNVNPASAGDDQLIIAARHFWETQHGEE